jgi:hypothetical protein
MSSASTPDTTTKTATHCSVRLTRQPKQPEKLVRIMAGTVTLTGLALGFFVSPWGYLLTAFAGANILQSAFTGFCPPEITYRWWRKTHPLPAAASDRSSDTHPAR